ncbi:MAG: hypothetical protein ACRBB0_19220 [Pelagimonas sp.]|uniref:hypothetical protein n=1 Tax=Pelagimonas sp. TaxID=2073170 RepID=UPI003D6A214C
MKTAILIAAVMVTNSVLASSALACVPERGVVYDSVETLPQGVMSIGLATVTDVQFLEPEKTKACFITTYADGQAKFGAFPTAFSVKTCHHPRRLQRLRTDQASLQEFTDILGYAAGAEVVLGIVDQPDVPQTPYRYFVPSCWGALHLRLDTLNSDERAEFMLGINDMVTSFEANSR